MLLGAVLVLATGASSDEDGERLRRLEDAARVLKETFHAPHEPCTEHDERGRPFAVCFDPWKGLEVGGGPALDTGGLTGTLLVDLRFRGERESRSKQESTWLTLHRVGAFSLRGVEGHVAVRTTLWNGYFRRHVPEGVLLVPTTPPLRLPFPLDVALSGEVLTYERRLAEGDDWALEPARLAFLLDPLRAASSRFHLGLGALAGYRMRSVSGVLVHDLTPLTAATLFADVESEDGLWVLRASAAAGWTFSPGAPSGAFRARGELDAARTLAALNDQPLSVFVHARAAWADAGARATSEVVVTAGVRLTLFSSR
ncbi:MAG: hypothetical protein AB1938_17705 [Myxococcota bacterium]